MYGLDKPLPVQFLLYVKSTLTFDFGISFLTGRPVLDELRSRLPNTVFLLGTSLLISSSSGHGSAWPPPQARKPARKRSAVERCDLLLLPSFFVQLLLLMAFASAPPLFPLRGTSPSPHPREGGLSPEITSGTWPGFLLSLLGFGGWALTSAISW
ncbi:hypothetical protein MASR2M79_19560 [Aminivibrio sp.]